MVNEPGKIRWRTLDRDLRRISRLEVATLYVSRPLVAPGIALAFIVLAALSAAIFFGP
ncbi:MAG: inorganic phosphate transporter, partial [Paracoccaceae bacterium]